MSLPVVLENGCLAGEEAVQLRPTEAQAHAQVSGLGRLVVGAGILGDVEPGKADLAGRAGDGHERIEDGCGRFRCVVSVRLCLEPDHVDCSFDLGVAHDLGRSDLQARRRPPLGRWAAGTQKQSCEKGRARQLPASK